jgi:hypothetical protein
MPPNREIQLTQDHWNYNEKVLRAALTLRFKTSEDLDYVLALCKVLYIESGIHFYRHAKEDLSVCVDKTEKERKE